jgi:O-antigen/teichoic acid export membrane protein
MDSAGKEEDTGGKSRSDSLKSLSIRGLGWDLYRTLFQHGIGLATSVILARILLPKEFGLAAMASVFISILQLLTSLGSATALIQDRRNTPLTYSSVFYLNISLGAALTLIVQIAAPHIAGFYGDGSVEILVRLLSINIFLYSLNIVQRSMLTRSIDFKSLAFQGIASQFVTGLSGILFALCGWGVYALVASSLAGSLSETIILWRATGWRPAPAFSWYEIKKLAKMSLSVFWSQSAGEMLRHLETMVIGRIFSPASLGYFGKANALNNLVSYHAGNSFRKVLFPVFSRMGDDDARFRKALVTTLHFLSFSGFAAAGCLFFAGRELILLLFGEAWIPASRILQMLALYGFASSFESVLSWSFLCKGRPKEFLRLDGAKKAIQLLALSTALFLDFESFLWALVAGGYGNWLLNVFLVAGRLGLSLHERIAATAPYVLAVLVGAMAAEAWRTCLNGHSHGFADAAVFGMAYLSMNYFLGTRGFRESAFHALGAVPFSKKSRV